MSLKKVLLAVLSVIIVIIIAGFFAFIFPFIGTKKIQDGTSFAGGRIINVADSMGQAFIIDGGNREIGLIDAGDSPDGKPIITALSARGFKPSDVKAIFLTHGHRDHIGAVKIFTSAKIYSLKDEVENAEGIKNSPSPMGRMMSPKPTGFKITNILNHGETINFGSLKIEVFAIPGHTEGCAAYLINGVLLLGDAALATATGKIKPMAWIFSSSIDQQNKSLKILAEKLKPRKNEIKNILFSHTGSLDGLQPLIDYTDTLK